MGEQETQTLKVIWELARAQREENFFDPAPHFQHFVYLPSLSLEIFHFQKFVYLRGVFGESLNFQLAIYSCAKSKKTPKKRQQKKNEKFLGFPTGVWEDEFSVGKPFCSGAGEKETQTLKVVWELKAVGENFS